MEQLNPSQLNLPQPRGIIILNQDISEMAQSAGPVPILGLVFCGSVGDRSLTGLLRICPSVLWYMVPILRLVHVLGPQDRSGPDRLPSLRYLCST